MLTFSCWGYLSRLFSLEQSPTDQWIVHEGLEHCHERVFIIPQDRHGNLASILVTAMYTANLEPQVRDMSGLSKRPKSARENHLHGMREHASQPEWHFFWEFISMHGDFEAITKVDMDDLAGDTI
jgi:hypothetical protein